VRPVLSCRAHVCVLLPGGDQDARVEDRFRRAVDFVKEGVGVGDLVRQRVDGRVLEVAAGVCGACVRTRGSVHDPGATRTRVLIATSEAGALKARQLKIDGDAFDTDEFLVRLVRWRLGPSTSRRSCSGGRRGRLWRVRSNKGVST
jgi:hypothetical protein